MVCGKPLDNKAKQRKIKKGLWSPDEDLKLRNYVLKHGHGCWSSVPINAGLQRNGKSCRLRWINYLRPGLKRGMFSPQEEEAILSLHAKLGNKWSQIAQNLPGRTDNEIKNYWHSFLKKKVSNDKTGETGGQVRQVVKPEASSSINSYLEPSPSTIESVERLDGSQLTSDTEQSWAQSQLNFRRDQLKGEASNKSNLLPRILFAEWLSLDQFRDQNNNSHNSGNPPILASSASDFECYGSDIEAAFMHHDDLFAQAGTFSNGGGSIHLQGPNNGFMHHVLHHPTLKFEDNISGNDFIDFINGQFNSSSGDLFL